MIFIFIDYRISYLTFSQSSDIQSVYPSPKGSEENQNPSSINEINPSNPPQW